MGEVTENEPQKSSETNQNAKSGTTRKKRSTTQSVESSEESKNVKKKRISRKRTLDAKTKDSSDIVHKKCGESSINDKKDLENKSDDVEQTPVKGPGIPYIPRRSYNNGAKKKYAAENFDINEFTRKRVLSPIKANPVQHLSQRVRTFFTKKLERQKPVASVIPEDNKVSTEAQNILKSQKPPWFPKQKWTYFSHIPSVSRPSEEHLKEPIKFESDEKPPWIPQNMRKIASRQKVDRALTCHPDKNHRRKNQKPLRIPSPVQTSTDQQEIKKEIDDPNCSENETKSLELEVKVEVDQVETTTNNNFVLNLCSITLNKPSNSIF